MDVSSDSSYSLVNEKSYCPQQVIFRNGLHFAVYTLQSTLRFTLCGLHFAVYTVVYILWFTLCSLHCGLHFAVYAVVYTAVYTLQFTLVNLLKLRFTCVLLITLVDNVEVTAFFKLVVYTCKPL